MKRILLLVTIMVFSASSCRLDQIDFDEMSRSQEAFERELANEMAIFMPIERMFPDPQALKLAKAAGAGRLRSIENLVEAGADVNYRGTKGATVLFWAFREENLRGFEKLLELGADPNLLFDDSSVIHWAAQHRDTRYLAAALEHGGNPDLRAGTPKKTPLFETLGIDSSDNPAARKILIEAGADVDARAGNERFASLSMGGMTTSMVAADLSRFDIVLELIGYGADPLLRDDNRYGIKERALSFKGRFPSGSKQEKDLEQVLNILNELDAR